MKLNFAVCVHYSKVSSICPVVAIIEYGVARFRLEIGFFYLSNRL